MIEFLDSDLELHAWPLRPVGGQHVGSYGHGVLAIHKPTGLAAVSADERSQFANRTKAIARLHVAVNAVGIVEYDTEVV